LYEPVRRGGDAGVPIVIGEPGSAPGLAFMAAAERVAQQVSIASYSPRTIPLAEVH
jgi:ATP-binding protein involved in chromosome partitioning